MQLVGEAVRHDIFGKGVVTELGPRSLTICFQRGEKRFLYPDAFADHLILQDDGKQREIRDGLEKRRRAEEARRQEQLEEEQRKQQLWRCTEKISDCAQAAFAVQDPEKVLAEWTVSTGVYLGGASKGLPRQPDRMKPNSLCLVTALPEGGGERDRRIRGVFMVEEDFLGDRCRDGVIRAHPRYRLRLAEENSPLFWPYTGVVNVTKKWGRTAFKYLDNTLAERILFDMLQSLRGSEDYAGAEALYRYYCRLNHLPARTTEE